MVPWRRDLAYKLGSATLPSAQSGNSLGASKKGGPYSDDSNGSLFPSQYNLRLVFDKSQLVYAWNTPTKRKVIQGTYLVWASI